MWIFKDNCGNLVTNSKIEYTKDAYAPGVLVQMLSNHDYLIVDLNLEPASEILKGFILIVSDNADPDVWIKAINRCHPNWNLRPYKVIGVEWE